MDIEDLYNLIESHLDNSILYSPNGKMKRVKLPIPPEYGGGFATGNGYLETVRHLIERVRPTILEAEEASSPLFKESWEKWIKIKEGQNRSPSTIESYKGVAKVHLLPFFGEMRINKIKPDDVQNYFNTIMNLSKSVSNQSKAILSGIFDRAIRQGEVDRNIMLYKYERSHKSKQKTVLQDKDLLEVIEKAEGLKESGDERDYLYFCFLCFTALRRGEILGLRWRDLDFEKEEITVRSNVTFPNGRNDACIVEPKDGSVGVVHLNSELSKRIRDYRRGKNEYVIPYSESERMRPVTKSIFVKMWKRIGDRIDLHGATSHSFRASYATMINAHCERIDPKALQGALRHKTPDLAIKVYTKENHDKTRIAEKEYDEYLCRALSQHGTQSTKAGTS